MFRFAKTNSLKQIHWQPLFDCKIIFVCVKVTTWHWDIQAIFVCVKVTTWHWDVQASVPTLMCTALDMLFRKVSTFPSYIKLITTVCVCRLCSSQWYVLELTKLGLKVCTGSLPWVTRGTYNENKIQKHSL